MTKLYRLVLIFSYCLIQEQAFAVPDSCKQESVPKADEIVSVSIGFSDYRAGAGKEGRISDVPGSDNDARFYNRLGSAMTHHAEVWDEKFAGTNTPTKAIFLSKLKDALKDAKVINFNYAGHGIRLHDGNWALALPSMPARCVHLLSPKSEGKTSSNRIVNPERSLSEPMDDSSCSDFMVTNSELEDVFRGRPVFGIIDSCYAGAIALKNQHMLVSSRADQESQGLSFGELSHKLRDLIDDKSCALDQDKDGQISLAELTATLPPVPMPKLRYPEVAAGQDMGYKGNFDWAQCIPLSGTDFKCRPPIKVGDVLEIATANVVPQMHGSYKVGGVCTLQPGDKVRVQKMISQMDATVQLPPNRGCPKSANIALTGTWNKTPLTQPQAETRSAATPSSAK